MEEYGSAGLRTLCLSYAELDPGFYDEWEMCLVKGLWNSCACPVHVCLRHWQPPWWEVQINTQGNKNKECRLSWTKSIRSLPFLSTCLRWQQGYFAAKTSLQGRDAKLAEVSELIEKNLVLLGCTAIEDKLQVQNSFTCSQLTLKFLYELHLNEVNYMVLIFTMNGYYYMVNYILDTLYDFIAILHCNFYQGAVHEFAWTRE
jgi:hypothetical protein